MNNRVINDALVNGLLEEALSSRRQRANMILHESNDDGCLRMINALLPTTVVPVHRHKNTPECITILKGRIVVVLYGETGGVADRVLLDRNQGVYGMEIAKGQWHTIEVLEPSVILEVKAGPYAQLEPDEIMD